MDLLGLSEIWPGKLVTFSLCVRWRPNAVFAENVLSVFVLACQCVYEGHVLDSVASFSVRRVKKKTCGPAWVQDLYMLIPTPSDLFLFHSLSSSSIFTSYLVPGAGDFPQHFMTCSSGLSENFSASGLNFISAYETETISVQEWLEMWLATAVNSLHLIYINTFYADWTKCILSIIIVVELMIMNWLFHLLCTEYLMLIQSCQQRHSANEVLKM